MELLEIWDWNSGKPTGRSVERGEAHKNGTPHEGVHLWIIRTVNGRNEVLFQQRAKDKKSYPDCLDITVGGHVPFGLNEDKIHKEAIEEIGIDLKDLNLIDLGHFRYEEIIGDVFHREFQRVYILKENKPLSDYSFNDGEVTGIYAVPFDSLKKIMHDDFSFKVEGFTDEGAVERTVAREDFHPLLFHEIMANYMKVLYSAMDDLFGM